MLRLAPGSRTQGVVDVPIRTWIDDDRQIIRAEAWGEYTTEEILRAASEILAFPKYSSRYPIVSDHRRVTRIAAPEQLNRLMVHLTANRSVFAGRRWAIVTGSHAAYGMARMMAGHAERVDIPVGSFTDFDEAIRWATTEGSRAAAPVLAKSLGAEGA